MKLFLETKNWTYVAIVIGFLSVAFYYISVIVLTTESVSSVFQPEANQLFFRLFGSGKAWAIIMSVPFIVLIPDITLSGFR